VGFNKDWLDITFNQYNSGNSFVKSRIFAWKMADIIVAAATSIPVYDDVNGFTMAPARTYDASTTTVYLLGNWNGAAGQLRLGTLVGDSTVTPTYTAAASFPTGSTWTCCSSGASQLGSAALIDNGDNRMIACMYRNGTLWAAHGVVLPSPTRNVAQWWQIATNGSVLQQGRIQDATGTLQYAYPSLAVNGNNDVLIGYSRFSSGQYAGANYSLHANFDAINTTRDDTVLKAGENTYGHGRWGDYSATVIDPANDVDIWTIQEYAGATANNWSTWWGRFNLAVSNDTCATAKSISIPSTSTQITIDATTAGDPTPSCRTSFGRGVWYRITAVNTGTIYINTEGSNFDTVLTAFSGSCGALTEVACDDDSGTGLLSSTSFSATSGTSYYVMASGFGAQAGSLILNVAAPTAVTGLTATPGNGQVALSWTAASLADGYHVKRSTIGGGPYTTVGTTSGTTFINTGLTNGTAYYFVVAGYNASGDGPQSNEVVGTPSALAGGGVLISGVEMNTTIQGYLTTLGHASTIVDPANIGSAPFTGYSAIWLGYMGSGSYTGLASRSTDLTNFMKAGGNVIVEYADVANPITDFPYGSELTPVTTFGDTVDVVAPTNAVMVGLTDSDLSNWGSSWHRYFTGIGSFTGVSDNTTGGQWVTFVKQVGAGHYVITGQDPSYHAQFGAGATGAFSPKMLFVNNALNYINQKPAQITGVVATPSDTKVQLTWTATTAATAYRVRRGTVSGGPYSTVATVSAANWLNTGLTNGTTYYYVVAGTNILGDGPNSVQTPATPFAVIPGQPTGLVAKGGDAKVTLTWNATLNASFYRVRRSTTSGGPYTTIASVTNNIFGNTGLTNGTTYYYVVAGASSAGTGPNSAEANAKPIALPPAPTGLTATPGAGKITLTWNPAAGATGYRVRRSAVSGGPYGTIATVGATTWANTGLSSGSTFFYVVAGFNVSGDGPNSAQASATVP
jgi:fibronectin type 3 domain-containing protein